MLPHARLADAGRLRVSVRPKDRLKTLLMSSGFGYIWSYRLFRLASFLVRRPHEPDFAMFGSFAEREGIFLDVGANAGWSALSFRIFNRRTPILSIEANPVHEPSLRFIRRLLRHFEYRILGAGEVEELVELHVPIYKRTPLDELAFVGDITAQDETLDWWARKHLGRPARRDELRIQTMSIAVRPLDALGLTPAFIKIDVEGHELSVVKGLQNTLARHHPVLLIERSRTFDALRQLLAPDYDVFVYQRASRSLRAYAGEPVTNLWFVPRGGSDARC